jgi:hypothetical protein
MPLHLAMWSGPRNISTAMMRAWGNRPDTFVCDEPLYAHYLVATGRVHPGRDEVIAAGETDWRAVVNWLTGAVPQSKSVFFQKHMAHHLLPQIERDWLGRVTNAFLIRDPREMITSLLKKVPDARLEDTGLPQQVEIFRLVHRQTGRIPPVLDAKDVLNDPRRQLALLCDAVGVEFTAAMLSWPPGLRDTDGVWAKYWYHEVEKTTTFQPFRPKAEDVPEEFMPLYRECLPYYDELYAHRLDTVQRSRTA